MTYANLAKALHTEASHRDDEDNKPRKNPSIGAMVALARLLDGRSLYDAFGAPGDWGYETPVGEALASLYRTPDASPTTARISFGPVATLVKEFTAANDTLRARIAEWEVQHGIDRASIASMAESIKRYHEREAQHLADISTLKALLKQYQQRADPADVADLDAQVDVKDGPCGWSGCGRCDAEGGAL